MGSISLHNYSEIFRVLGIPRPIDVLNLMLFAQGVSTLWRFNFSGAIIAKFLEYLDDSMSISFLISSHSLSRHRSYGGLPRETRFL